MSTNGILDFQNTNKIIFRGSDSNVVIDTSNVSLGIGIQGTETPGSNLHVVGNAFISSNLKLTTDTSILVNSNVVAEYTGPHSRDPKAVPLKKYPEIAFEKGKFDHNTTTNTFVQAGYTITSSGNYSDDVNSDYTVWRAFTGLINLFDPGWVSPFGSYTSGVANSTQSLTNIDNTTSTGGVSSRNGAWVKLELPTKIKLGRVDFYDRYDDIEGTATQFERVSEAFVYGGNSNSGPWYEIGKQSDATNIANYTDDNPASLTIDTTSYYKYYIIQPTQLAKTISYGSYGQLMFYGYEEDPPTGDTSVDTTFTSIMNTPQTTGANVYTDAKLSSDFTNQVTGPTPVGTAAVHDNTNKYWEMNGQLTSNITVEANTFLEGDQPHAVSVWFNSSNLEANVSNTCVFSVSDQEKLDSVNLDLQSNTWHNLTYAYQGEGGSRVTYLDGRKVAEDQAEDTFGDYPPFAMTGYAQGGYVVSASAENGAGFSAWKAFNNEDGSGGDSCWSVGVAWAATDNFFSGTTSVENEMIINLDGVPNTTVGGVGGHWINLELPHKLVVNYIEIHPRYDPSYDWDERIPEQFYIAGSNDGYHWYTIHHKNTNGVPAIGSVDTQAMTGAYRNVGFKNIRMYVTKVGNGQNRLDIGIINYYGHRENDLVRLPDPTNVLKYPHIAMTGPAQRGYVVSASSDTGSALPWHAFDGDISHPVANATAWQSISGGYNVSGAFDYKATGAHTSSLTSTGNVQHDGEYIQLETPHKIIVQSFNIYSSVTHAGLRPAKFVLLGSNTGIDGQWNILHTQTTAATYDSNHLHVATVNSSVAYKYHALLTKNITSNYLNVGTLWIGELEFFGTGVDSVPIQIGGGNIDKVANFRVYDKFVGEDQALEIWDAQKDEFRGVKNSVTLHKGRLGIGTDEPQGRLAVADEPHNLEEFPPRAMTGYKTHFEGHGEFCASASSYFGTYYPWEAFDRNITDNSSDQAVWHTTADFTNATPGIYNAGASLGGYTGAWLKLKLPYSIKPSKVSIHPRTYPGGTSNYDQNPKDFLILGSKDDNTWDVLSTQVGVVFGTTWKEFILSPGNNNYKYFAISCTKTKHGSYFAINDMKYFGTREQGQSVLHDGQLTLTKSLTVPRIGPALDADDTPRRDRLVVEYNTSTNPTFEGAVRDTSGRGNDGVFRGSASYDATQKSLEFPSNPVTGSTSGTYDSIFAGDIFKRKITQHTVSLWLKPNSMGAWEQVYGIGQNASAKNEGLWISGTDTLAVHTEGSNPSQQYHYTIGNVNGQWIHVTHVRNSLTFNDHILYVNGIPLTATTTAGGTGTMSIPEESDLRIGGRIMGNDNYWLDGSISNFKLYDTVLTAEEVKTLYDMGRCDEGHHVVNFSKTRVGIGLGDGEAPRGVLDVRGETPFIGPGLVIHQAASGNWGTEGDPANMNGLLLTLEGESGLTSGSSYWNIAAQATGSGSLLFAHRGKATAFIDVNKSGESLDFTGQHRTFIKDVPFSQAGDLEGLIVSSDQNKYIKMSGGIEAGSNAIMINESLPVVSLSNVVTDKRCFGVISASEDPEQRSDSYGSFVTPYEKEKGDTRVFINSVGEGAIWVVNTNGSLEAGDYITTSNVAGYGQKQNDDVLHNYTVAKITMDCDFEPATQPVQQILRSNVVETYYLGNVHKVKNVPHEFVTTTVTANDDWSNVSISPSDTTYAEWSNLEANTQNTYTLTYTQTSNVVYDVKYTKTTTANVTESDAWDRVFVDPPTVTYAEYSNLEANTQNTYTLTYTQTTTDEKTPDEWSTLESNVQSLYNEVYYQSVEEEVAKDYPGAVAHTRVTNVIENELDVHGQIQWGDHPTETEKAYKIRYLDASGAQTDEANAVHIAAFVGCTYHCG